MQGLHDAVYGRDRIATQRRSEGIGFSCRDVTLLCNACREGIADRGWGRAQLTANTFAHYLAVWDKTAVGNEPPILAIIRFDRTGTYALLSNGKFVANGNTLEAILPALAVARATCDA